LCFVERLATCGTHALRRDHAPAMVAQLAGEEEVCDRLWGCVLLSPQGGHRDLLLDVASHDLAAPGARAR
jgi:hypothetical protein